MSTLPGRLVLLVEGGIETGGMVRIYAAGALDEIILRLPLQLAAGAGRRTVVARPGYPSIDEYRELLRRAGVVQSRATDAAPA